MAPCLVIVPVSAWLVNVPASAILGARRKNVGERRLDISSGML